MLLLRLVRHSAIFEDQEENKLEYMPIFNSWTALIEKHLELSLAARIPNFKMEDFMKVVPSREDQIDPELYDMLLSLGDFQTFKEEMLMAKSASGGSVDLGNAFVVHRVGDKS